MKKTTTEERWLVIICFCIAFFLFLAMIGRLAH